MTAEEEASRLLGALEELLKGEQLALDSGDLATALDMAARVFPVLKALAHALEDYAPGRTQFAPRIAAVQRTRAGNLEKLAQLRDEGGRAIARNTQARRNLKSMEPAYGGGRLRSTFSATM